MFQPLNNNRPAGEFPGRFACARWMRCSSTGQGQFRVSALLEQDEKRSNASKSRHAGSFHILSHPFTSFYPLTDNRRFLKFLKLGKLNTLCAKGRASYVGSCMVSLGAQLWVAKTTSDESPLRRAAELVEYEGSGREPWDQHRTFDRK